MTTPNNHPAARQGLIRASEAVPHVLASLHQVLVRRNPELAAWFRRSTPHLETTTAP